MQFCLLDSTNWLGRNNSSWSCLRFPHVYHLLSSFGVTHFVFYALSHCMSLRIYFSVSLQGLDRSHPLSLQATEMLHLRLLSFPDPVGLPGRECMSWVFGKVCPEPSLMWFSFTITSCLVIPVRQAGYYLFVPAVREIINVFGRSLT